MVETLLTLAYAALFSLWILRGRLWSRTRIRRPVLVGLFFLQSALGIGYGLIYSQYYRTGDVVHYFQDSQVIYSALPERPEAYLELTFGFSRDGKVPEYVADLYEDRMRLGRRTQEYLPVRVNALLNLFSFGHYSVNVLFMALAVLGALVVLHGLFAEVWPARAGPLAVGVFLIPSTLFWCSGIHKDGITVVALTLVLWGLTRLAHRGRLRFFAGVVIGVLLLLGCRAYLLLLLLPNAALYAVSLRRRWRALPRFAVLNVLLVVAFVYAPVVDPRMDLVAKLQFEQDFMKALIGNTHLAMRPIGTDLWGILAGLPAAFDHVLLQPIRHRPEHVFQWAAAIDAVAQLALAGLLLWAAPWRRQPMPPIAAFSIVYALAVFALIGMSVPLLGAIVRYKSVVLPFLFATGFGYGPLRALAGTLRPPGRTDRVLLPSTGGGCGADSPADPSPRGSLRLTGLGGDISLLYNNRHVIFFDRIGPVGRCAFHHRRVFESGMVKCWCNVDKKSLPVDRSANFASKSNPTPWHRSDSNPSPKRWPASGCASSPLPTRSRTTSPRTYSATKR